MIWGAAIVMGAFGLLFGSGLALAGKIFQVKLDPREEKILDIMPRANCGACGCAGCNAYASMVVKGKIEVGKCPVGGVELACKIAEILGQEAVVTEGQVAVVKCQGKRAHCADKFTYDGVQDCTSAGLLFGGNKGCSYGCLGWGTCFKVCPFNAIHFKSGEPPVIIPEACKACGLCVDACPRNIIELVPAKQQVFILCNSLDKGKKVREVCKIGCIGCGICAKVCPEDAIEIKDNLAVIDYSKCVNCGLCVGKCPTKAIKSLGDTEYYTRRIA